MMNRKLVNSRFRAAPWAGLIPMAALLAVITIAPGIDAALSSLFRHPGTSAGWSAREFIGLGNYRFLFSDRAILYSLNITAAWAACNAGLTTGAGLLLAQFMHHRSVTRKRRSRRRTPPLFTFLLISLGIPIYIAVPIWRAFLHGDGGASVFARLTGITMNMTTDPYAAFFGALMVSVWMNVPLAALVLYSHISRISSEVIDAVKLETGSRLELLRCIQLPIIRSSVLIMASLSFVKAAKEFTLIHLMTDGGVPLVSGITEHYIIGSTTTLSVFLYSLFTSLDSYGLSAAYAVLMAGFTAITMLFWVLSTLPNPLKQRRAMTMLLMLLFLIAAGYRAGSREWADMLILLVFFTGFCISLGIPRIFGGAAGLFIILVILKIFIHGFLEGFSALLPAVLFTLVHVSSGKPGYGIPLGRLADCLYSAVSWAAAGLLAVSSVLISSYLVWLSLSRLNVCYIDALLPRDVTFDSYVKIFAGDSIHRYFLNSARIAASTALLMPLVVIPAAWHLAQLEGRKANALVSSVHVISTMGGMHSLIPLFAVFLMLGLINSHGGLVLVYAAHAVPFSLITMKNFFEGMSRNLREPAVIEGASTLQYILSVLLPLSRPILKTTMLLAFLGAWNGFMAPLLFLHDQSLYPVSMKLYTYVGSGSSANPQWNLFAAASVVNLVIVLLLGSGRFDRFKEII